MNKRTLENLATESVKWQRHPSNGRYFFAYNNGDLILLRQNDFPDEPLLSIICGLEIIDLDEVPTVWEIPW